MRAALLVTLLLLAGCVSPAGDVQPAADAGASDGRPLATTEVRITYVAAFAAGHPTPSGSGFSFFGLKGEAGQVPENATRIVGTATWTSTAGTPGEMVVRLHGDGDVVARLVGKSGLAFELDAKQVKALSGDEARATLYPVSPGAAGRVELVVVLQVDAPAPASSSP